MSMRQTQKVLNASHVVNRHDWKSKAKRIMVEKHTSEFFKVIRAEKKVIRSKLLY